MSNRLHKQTKDTASGNATVGQGFTEIYKVYSMLEITYKGTKISRTTSGLTTKMDARKQEIGTARRPRGRLSGAGEDGPGGRGRSNYGGGTEGGWAPNGSRQTKPVTSMKAAAAVAVAGGGGKENGDVPHKTLPSGCSRQGPG